MLHKTGSLLQLDRPVQLDVLIPADAQLAALLTAASFAARHLGSLPQLISAPQLDRLRHLGALRLSAVPLARRPRQLDSWLGSLALLGSSALLGSLTQLGSLQSYSTALLDLLAQLALLAQLDLLLDSSAQLGSLALLGSLLGSTTLLDLLAQLSSLVLIDTLLGPLALLDSMALLGSLYTAELFGLLALLYSVSSVLLGLLTQLSY